LPEQAVSRLSHLCSRSEKSVFDIKKKLSDWNFSAQETETIIKKLQLSGFVDDRRYAKAFAHDKSALSCGGGLKIYNALKNKHISSDIINEALAGLDNLTVKKNLTRLLSVKKRSLAGLPPAEHKVKLLRFALNRGYSYEEVCQVMKEEG
jgi:regulatory protein